MPYNKIIYKNNTLIDLTGDSVSRETLARGVTAHDKAGNPIVGEANFPITLQEKSITQNGEYTPDTGYDGFSKVNVNVADIPATLQEKTATPTTSQQSITPDSGYEGLSKVTINAIPSQYIIPTGELEITENGSYDVTEKASVKVNVPTGSGGDWVMTEEANDTGTTGVFEFVGAEDVTLTVQKAYIHWNRPWGNTYLSLTKPTSASDYDYSSDGIPYYDDTVTIDTVKVPVGSIVYVWGTYYNGTTACGTTYDTATEITISEDTTIVLQNCGASGGSA